MAKKIKKREEKKEELSIIDLAKHEKIQGVGEDRRPDGSGKKYTKELFKTWVMLPDTFKGQTERITELLGITDETTLYLLQIKTMRQFAEDFGVIPQTLSRWRSEIESGNEYFADMRKTMKPLTKNLVAALYRKAIAEGDAARFTAWMKIIEGWREQLGIDMTADVTENLSDEDRKRLDKMIAKNKR